METIKFRIYNPERKKMIEGGATPTMLSSFFENTATLNTVHKMKYQQFTGLLDKHGKEIYEGDIVKPWAFNKSSGNLVHSTLPARVVVWKNNFNSTGFNLRKGDRCEVIGNIYENKDLII